MAWRPRDATAELRHGRFAMRDVWFFAFCPRRLLGVILAGGLAFTSMGCHQNYYYYGDSCPSGTPLPSTVRAGAVCDVPTEVVEGGTKLAGWIEPIHRRQWRGLEQVIARGRQRAQ